MTKVMSGPPATGAVMVTHNPDFAILLKAVDAVAPQVTKGIIVDNCSSQPERIREILPPHFMFHANLKNLGIARALNQGVVKIMSHGNIDWILTLDQDVVLAPNYVKLLLDVIAQYPNSDRLGIVAGSLPYDSTGTRQLISPRHFFNAGNIIRSTIFKQTRFREEFFIDFVDCDFLFRVRALGFEVLTYDWPMLTHSLGRSQTILGRTIRYEPSGRYYYIVRNTTILFKEGKLTLGTYTRQVTQWGFMVMMGEGFSPAVRTFFRGLVDAIGGRLNWECTGRDSTVGELGL